MQSTIGQPRLGQGAAHDTDNVAPVFVIFMILPLSGSVSVSESGSKIPGSVPLDFACGFDSDCEPLRAVGSPSRKPIPIPTPTPIISVSTDTLEIWRADGKNQG